MTNSNTKSKNIIKVDLNNRILDKKETQSYCNTDKNRGVDSNLLDLSIEINNNNFVHNFPFKKKHWSSKLRSHEKATNRAPKNMKSMIVDNLDNISYLQCIILLLILCQQRSIVRSRSIYNS